MQVFDFTQLWAGRRYDKPTVLTPEDDRDYHLYQIYSDILIKEDALSQVEAINRWFSNNLYLRDVVPGNLKKALCSIEKYETIRNLSDFTNMSIRQIERYFKIWLGMTPKHYQRILRIKKSINFLRLHQDAKLADVAHRFGFSDQAHMTREFQTIARISPGKV